MAGGARWTSSVASGQVLAMLSHELRTPLTPVPMTIAVREKDPNLLPALRADMGMIRRNVELETKLIDDLLDLNRITSGKPGTCDLNSRPTGCYGDKRTVRRVFLG